MRAAKPYVIVTLAHAQYDTRVYVPYEWYNLGVFVARLVGLPQTSVVSTGTSLMLTIGLDVGRYV
jgi:hypothetical protein